MVTIPGAALDNRALSPKVSLRRRATSGLTLSYTRYLNIVYTIFDKAYNAIQTHPMIVMKRLMLATIVVTHPYPHSAYVNYG